MKEKNNKSAKKLTHEEKRKLIKDVSAVMLKRYHEAYERLSKR